MDFVSNKGVFLWDDPDQDQWSNITRIMVHQKNRRILVQSGFIGCFDAPWSEWSWMTDPDPDHPKGKHSNFGVFQIQLLLTVCFPPHDIIPTFLPDWSIGCQLKSPGTPVKGFLFFESLSAFHFGEFRFPRTIFYHYAKMNDTEGYPTKLHCIWQQDSMCF